MSVYFALDGLVADVLWNVAVLAQLALAAVIVSGFGRRRLAWSAIIAGQACFLAGDIGFTVLEFGLDEELFPSFADWLYLAGYPLIAVGLIPIVRTRNARRDAGGLIDAAIVTVAAAAILWVFIMDPTVNDSETGLLARMVAVAYTVGDVLALAMLALLLARRRANPWPLALTAASVATLFVADTAYALMALQSDGYSLGNPVDALWWISYTLIVLAVMHPDCEHLGDGVDNDPPRLSRRRVGALAAAAVSAPVVLIAQGDAVSPSQVTVLLGSTVLLFVLVIARLQLIASDLDESRIRLAHDATHDSLTGLANRALFGNELREAIDDTDGTIAVLCLDIDDFKSVNDELGHPIGDRLLQIVSGRLADALRSDDLVARLGGDEFAVLLRSSDAAGASSLADRVIRAIRRPADVGAGVDVLPNVSIGIAVGDATSTPDDLLRDADIALYRAKGAGKARWAMYEQQLGETVTNWLGLRTELFGALAAGQLAVEYQPVVRLPDRTIVGAEALLRWVHPDRGVVPPDTFIPIAEDSGLIGEIGAWVLEQACAAAQRWDPSPDGMHVSVNVSPLQVVDVALVADVRRALERSGLAPSRLVLEITETSEFSDETVAAEVLAGVRSLGVRIAIDDLGAGFAALRYLRTMSIDVVKIDRSFVGRIDGNSGLLRGLVGLASSLGLQTVVEGIETARQERLVAECGAGFAQGFLYARPMSSEHLRDVIARDPIPS